MSITIPSIETAISMSQRPTLLLSPVLAAVLPDVVAEPLFPPEELLFAVHFAYSVMSFFKKGCFPLLFPWIETYPEKIYLYKL